MMIIIVLYKVLTIEMKLSAMTTQQLIRVLLQDMVRQQV